MKLSLNKNKTLQMIKNTSLIIIGTCILAFGASIFQVQFDLVMGGMTGLAIVFRKIFPNVEFLTVDFYVWVMTAFFFVMGVIFLGKEFTMKTLISTIVYPPAFSLCGLLVDSDLFGGLLNFATGIHADAALIVAAVFGGLLDGVGTAIAFLGGGSTGGVDILAITVEKKAKKITSAQMLLLINTVVILLGVFVIGNIVLSLLGIIAAFVSAAAIDRIFCNGSKAFTAQIISEKHEEIRIAAIEELGRTVTIIPCIGGYSKENKKMLQISFKMQEYSALIAILRRIDDSAFVTIHKAHEINGECWTWQPKELEAEKSSDLVESIGNQDGVEKAG